MDRCLLGCRPFPTSTARCDLRGRLQLVPTASWIIAAYLQRADAARRRDNAFRFQKILSNLNDQNETLRARILSNAINAEAILDPATDPDVLRLYRLANKRLKELYGCVPLPLPSPDCASVRRRELWETYRKAAVVLATVPLTCRFVFITLTATNKLSWPRRLAEIEERLKVLHKAVAVRARWHAHAFDVHSLHSEHGPHAHALYVVDGADMRDVAATIRALKFRKHRRWIDFEIRVKPICLLPDWERRRVWLDRLAYVLKVSGDCGERHFLPAEWDREFQHVALKYSAEDGHHALAVKAMYAHHVPRRRLFRRATKIKAAAPVLKKRQVKTHPKLSKGGQRKDRDMSELIRVCSAFPTMKDRADALKVSDKTLVRLMVKHGIPTPRDVAKRNE